MSIDVRRAIEKNAYVTSVADLEKNGRRHVKVIKTSTIRELINQAVENVHGSNDDSRSKQELVEETNQEFKRLLKDSQTQKAELDLVQTQIAHYKALITDLNCRIEHQEATIESLRAEAAEAPAAAPVDDAEVAAQRERTAALEQEVAEKTAELSELNARVLRIGSLEDEITALRSQVEKRETQLSLARENTDELEAELSKRDARIAALETACEEASANVDTLEARQRESGDVDAKLEEVTELLATERAERERLESEHAQLEAETSEKMSRMNDHLLRQEREIEDSKKLGDLNDEYKLKVASLTAEIRTIRENQPATDTLIAELRQMRDGISQLESRNRDLEMEAAQAKVAPQADTSNLEKLLEAKMSQISTELSAKLANMRPGPGGGMVDAGTSPEDIKNTIQAIFSHELEGGLDSNIADVKVKETKSAGIAGNLERLKNLGTNKG